MMCCPSTTQFATPNFSDLIASFFFPLFRQVRVLSASLTAFLMPLAPFGERVGVRDNPATVFVGYTVSKNVLSQAERSL